MAANELTDAFSAGSGAGQNIVNALAQRQQFQQTQSLAQQRLQEEMAQDAFNRQLAQNKFSQIELPASQAGVGLTTAQTAGAQATTAGTQASTQATNLANQSTQFQFHQNQNLLGSIVHNEITNLQNIAKQAQANGNKDAADVALAQLSYAQANPKEFSAQAINNYQKSQVQFEKTDTGYKISGSGTIPQIQSIGSQIGINTAAPPQQNGTVPNGSTSAQPTTPTPGGMFAPPIDTTSPIHQADPNTAAALGVPATAPNIYQGMPVPAAMELAKTLPPIYAKQQQDNQKDAEAMNIPIQLLQKFKALNANPELQSGISNQLHGKLPTSAQTPLLQEFSALQSKAIPDALRDVKLGRITQREFDVLTQSIVNPNNSLEANNNLADIQIANLRKEQSYKNFVGNYGVLHNTTAGANEAFDKIQPKTSTTQSQRMFSPSQKKFFIKNPDGSITPE